MVFHSLMTAISGLVLETATTLPMPDLRPAGGAALGQILLASVAVLAYGWYSTQHVPLDAIPNVGENQVIVLSEWMGRSPKDIEDQITYPLSVALQAVPGADAGWNQFGITTAVQDWVSGNAPNHGLVLRVQDELVVGNRLKLTLGGRYQTVTTEAEPTPGWDISGLDFDDETFVGTLGAIYSLTGSLKVTGSVGTAFRAPNIIERLFNGPTPEGAGYQILNADLRSEESENAELGLKYLRRNAIFELTYFRNDIDDGIIQDFLGPQEIDALLERREIAQDHHHCPHGRPTVLVFSPEQLDRQFKRI